MIDGKIVVDMEIRDMAPLIMHAFNQVEKTDVPGRPDRETPEYIKKELQSGLYLAKDGKTLIQQAESLKACLLQASAQFMIRGKGKTSYKRLVEAGVFIEPIEIKHKYQRWEDYAVRVRLGTSSFIRHRPMLRQWALDFQCVIVEPQLDTKTLKIIWDRAGAFVGMLDRRPTFGRFEVVKYNVRKGGK